MRPPTIWHPSPNFRAAPESREVSLIIIHDTETAALASPLRELCLPGVQKSAHFIIDVDGTIYQLVAEKDIAWHAGVSSWKGRSIGNSVNAFSIGIELVNPSCGKTGLKIAHPPAQLMSCAQLCCNIGRDRDLHNGDVRGHFEVAMPPGRKTDPFGFPWDDFRKILSDGGLA